MKENNLSQLVGAIGGWLQARPYGAEQAALDRAARIVLDMRLLGVDIDDVNAPELDALSPEDRDVVEQARVWAQARREEARQRLVAEERAARQRRVAEREAGPNEAFAWSPIRPVRETPSVVDRGEASKAPQPKPDHPKPVEPASVQPASVQPASVQPEPVPPALSVDGADSTAALADPSDHVFFSADDASEETRTFEVPTRSAARTSRLRPEAVFKVVIVVWSVAALGVLIVLLRIALG